MSWLQNNQMRWCCVPEAKWYPVNWCNRIGSQEIGLAFVLSSMMAITLFRDSTGLDFRPRKLNEFASHRGTKQSSRKSNTFHACESNGEIKRIRIHTKSFYWNERTHAVLTLSLSILLSPSLEKPIGHVLTHSHSFIRAFKLKYIAWLKSLKSRTVNRPITGD